MRLAIDANRYRDFGDRREDVLDTLEKAASVTVPLTVVGELFAGFRKGNRYENNRLLFDEFLSTDGVSIGMYDVETALYYGEVFAALKRQGKPIPQNDMWIAAFCLRHGLRLYTRDAHFARVPGLRLM